MLLGGAVAGQGAIDIYLLIAIAWFCGLGRRHDQLLHRPPPRPRVRDAARARASGSATSASSRSRTTSPATAARRSSSAASSASSAPSPPSSPAAPGCATAPSSPTASSAPGSGPAPTSSIGYFFSRSIETAGQVRRQRRLPARHPDRRRRRLGLPLPPLPGRGEPRARRCAGWRATRATRWLVVLGRRYRPQLRFLWDRVTPGGTFGLEFTSLMAILAVALFVLVAYIVIVGRDPGPTPGDETAIERRRTPPQPAGSSTSPRSSPSSARGVFTWALTAVCAVLLAARRRWTEFGVLLAGMTLIHDRRPRDQGRGRPAAPAGRRWSTPPAPPSPAATPPTRSSTSGWR